MAEHTDEKHPAEPGLIALASSLSDRVELKGIALFDCEIQREPGANLARESLQMAVGIPDVTYRIDKERNQVIVTPDFSLRAVREGVVNAETVLMIRASFDLTYGLVKFDELEDDNFRAFARTNGVFNAWPYWRELVQNLSARMGFRPVILPLFRIPN